jgi:hypothetical protein
MESGRYSGRDGNRDESREQRTGVGGEVELHIILYFDNTKKYDVLLFYQVTRFPSVS